ncbi:hypothetical protein M8818_006588 [Zalaria obscura]|uniref:Uncharacterized protein n=1 Tax=Zalaria obscura TaxID=2024903 RepID=A0ACC3S829_9PEZI
MRASTVLFALFRFLIPPAIIFTLLIYLYPSVQGCAFPVAKRAETSCLLEPKKGQNAAPKLVAPFRLLALGDPQLEGDTSLPDPKQPWFPSLLGLKERVYNGSLELADAPGAVNGALKGALLEDIPRVLQSYRKRLDLFGNDYYLAHIYRSIRWWTQPTHTVVLGDLLGSQWIDDGEFARRSDRFWKKVFRGAEKVPEEVMNQGGGLQIIGDLDWKAWENRIINVAGNHDIGYAGDIDSHRISRFESAFGKTNWDIRFQLPSNNTPSSTTSSLPFESRPAELQLVILNSMNLDSPAWDTEQQSQTHAFLNAHIQRPQRAQDATVLLTHIPLHKAKGICVDSTFFDYFPPEQGGGIREQNHLSADGSRIILSGLFGPADGEAPVKGRGIVLNGHDHEGCDVYHYRSVPDYVDEGHEDGDEEMAWQASHYGFAYPLVNNADVHGVREITMRSMMGSYGGYAGLVSAWFDDEAGEWRFDFATCMLGVQHIWWACHVLDLVVLGLGLMGVVAYAREEWLDRRGRKDGVKLKTN